MQFPPKGVLFLLLFFLLLLLLLLFVFSFGLQYSFAGLKKGNPWALDTHTMSLGMQTRRRARFDWGLVKRRLGNSVNEQEGTWD